MPVAASALQAAVFVRLTSDMALLAALGGAKVFDDAPRDPGFPYITFGQTVERDWSTASEEGSEHVLTLHVWSRARGKREAQAVMDAARAALHDQSLTLDGHHLVNLRHEFAETRRDPDGETYHGILRFRAVTEPQV